MSVEMANYNALFYDDIYFNFQQGFPFIQNAVLSLFLLTSCNLVRLQPLQYSQSAYVSRLTLTNHGGKHIVIQMDFSFSLCSF